MSTEYRIGEYLRLSLEDEKEGESVSIGGQRQLIQDYLSKNPILSQSCCFEFCDDGYSGTNFDRPGVKKLIDEIKKGNINCVIVKDLSRFGRNYVEVDRYIEQIFPFLGVRFIAVNDGYDSDNYKGITAGLDIPFKNLIYDLYSKDISKKVRSSKNSKILRGEYISAHALFGYKKSKENKNKLVVDKPAALVVKQIFQMALEGISTRQIAVYLNKENVLTPMMYKHQQGYDRKWNVIEETNIWTASAVLRVLKDERYTGKFVGNKWETPKVGGKVHKHLLQEKWIIVENTHEPIVSEEDYRTIQTLITAKSKPEKGTVDNRVFIKKVKCAYCGHMMRRKGSSSPYFYCDTATYSADFECTKVHIPEQDIVDIVLKTIRYHAKLAFDLKGLWMAKQQQASKMLDIAKKKLYDLIKDLEKLEASKVPLYEKYQKNICDRNSYLANRNSLDDKVDEIKEKIAKAESMVIEENHKAEALSHNAFMEAFEKYSLIKDLTAEVVNELVDEICIYDLKHIKIVVRYADLFKELLTQCNTIL